MNKSLIFSLALLASASAFAAVGNAGGGQGGCGGGQATNGCSAGTGTATGTGGTTGTGTGTGSVGGAGGTGLGVGLGGRGGNASATGGRSSSVSHGGSATTGASSSSIGAVSPSQTNAGNNSANTNAGNNTSISGTYRAAASSAYAPDGTAPRASCRLFFGIGGSNTSGALSGGIPVGNDQTCVSGAQVEFMDKVNKVRPGTFQAVDYLRAACKVEGMDQMDACAQFRPNGAAAAKPAVVGTMDAKGQLVQ